MRRAYARARSTPAKITGRTERGSNPLVFVDAQAVKSPVEKSSQAGPSSLIEGIKPAKGNHSLPSEDTEQDGEDMMAFQSMLKEYLDRTFLSHSRTGAGRSPIEAADERIVERQPVPPKSAPPPLPPPTDRLSGPNETEQYVYDLYFRDLRPSLSSTSLGLGVGDGVTIGALSV